ncbi:MAG: alpha/beta fold hydrolase [Burkholderiales bacterium]|nr:alpha/beta fold hydrolase [Burkholderiales bacterium]
MPNYILSARAVSKGAFVPEPGKPLFLEVPEEKPITTGISKFKIKGHQWLERVQTTADARAGRRASEAGDVLVFVHGYNHSLDEIRQRHEMLQADLAAEGWRGLVVSFDWPNDPERDFDDRTDAAEIANYLVTSGLGLIIKGQNRGCQTNVHLLGHSTGAFVIMEAFAAAEKKAEFYKNDWRIGQVAFIGGDVSSRNLNLDSQAAEPMFRRIMRLTNYQNGFDDVLGMSSKRIDTDPRIGRVGLTEHAHPKAVNVDCSQYFSQLDPASQPKKVGWWNHSWHIGNRVFARDLAMTLEGRIDRNYLPTRDRQKGELVLRDAPRPTFEAKWFTMVDA